MNPWIGRLKTKESKQGINGNKFLYMIMLNYFPHTCIEPEQRIIWLSQVSSLRGEYVRTWECLMLS